MWNWDTHDERFILDQYVSESLHFTMRNNVHLKMINKTYYIIRPISLDALTHNFIFNYSFTSDLHAIYILVINV